VGSCQNQLVADARRIAKGEHMTDEDTEAWTEYLKDGLRLNEELMASALQCAADMILSGRRPDYGRADYLDNDDTVVVVP
jgi:hypothetical protein